MKLKWQNIVTEATCAYHRGYIMCLNRWIEHVMAVDVMAGIC